MSSSLTFSVRVVAAAILDSFMSGGSHVIPDKENQRVENYLFGTVLGRDGMALLSR